MKLQLELYRIQQARLRIKLSLLLLKLAIYRRGLTTDTVLV